MSGQAMVVLPDNGPAPTGRTLIPKLVSDATGGSIMMFEETIPPGTKSVRHLHRDSDEIAYVVRGEVTFMIGDAVTTGGAGTYAFMPRNVPHCWKSTGAETGLVVFMYTPAKAGGLIEEQRRTGRKFADMSERELAELLDRHGWEMAGDSPL